MEKFNLVLKKITPENGVFNGYHLACSFEELYLQILRPDINPLVKKIEEEEEASIFTDVYFKTSEGIIYRIYKIKNFFNLNDWVLVNSKNPNMTYHLRDHEMYYGRLKEGEPFCFGIKSTTKEVLEIVCVNKRKFNKNILNLPECSIVKDFHYNFIVNNINFN